MLKKSKKRQLTIALVAIAALVIMLFIPQIVTTSYYLHLIIVTLIWIVLTSGLNIIQGYAGYVSMCQVAFYGIGAYVSGLMMSKLGLSMPVGLLMAVGIGLVVGTIIGLPSLRTKGHYFSIVTLAFAMLLFTIMKGWQDVTGGIQGFSIPPLKGDFFGLPLSSREGYFYIVLIAAVLTLLFVYRLFKSRTGRAIVTMRENENLAKAVGINATGTKLLAFNLSAVLGCVGGVLYAHYMNFVNPTTFAAGIGMNAILAVMIGGCGTVIGPIVGSVVVTFLPELLRAAELYRQLAFGVLIIVMVYLLPKGMVKPIVDGFKKLISKIKEKNNKENIANMPE
ncbi:MAG: branched-chain amino acid ABC transporter permease [Christensenella sp.]|uniref:branched-chain amino acid ABC transporter permease n=1 Tax=Christensenella sp. TaxID=1935934 RepID=UPI002B206C7D|nr:branched-chain amino acid ABC transporter permease [Christensenella sp.]MEA5003523.1 branched-chain amino acid ABC transporter permease [Christensenella sp.]